MNNTRKKCPNCGKSQYLNPKFQLFYPPCGHQLCDTCLQQLFYDFQAIVSCPKCKKGIKKYNKQRQQFITQEDWDQYLEQIEDIIYNLVQGINQQQMQMKIINYQKQNKSEITENNAKAQQIR